MILCLTPNPAIDRTMFLNSFQIGEVQRAEKVFTAAGGKGLNVARAIRTLGGKPFCMGLIGGHTGKLLQGLARHEGLAAKWTWTKNETRTCVILVRPNQDATVINDPGMEIDLHECKTFLTDAWEQSSNINLACVSGSLPPGFPLDQFEALLSGFVRRGIPVWVDTSGPALKTALGVRGVNIKINAAELESALDMEISDVITGVKAARRLDKLGVQQTVITFGKRGAILSSAKGIWSAKPPKVAIVSSVGSGDAFLGGLAVAQEAGTAPDISLRKAVAAGTANTLQFSGGMFSQKEFEKIYKNTDITVLNS